MPPLGSAPSPRSRESPADRAWTPDARHREGRGSPSRDGSGGGVARRRGARGRRWPQRSPGLRRVPCCSPGEQVGCGDLLWTGTGGAATHVCRTADTDDPGDQRGCVTGKAGARWLSPGSETPRTRPRSVCGVRRRAGRYCCSPGRGRPGYRAHDHARGTGPRRCRRDDTRFHRHSGASGARCVRPDDALGRRYSIRHLGVAHPSATCEFPTSRRGGRVAEGGGLLNRYRG